MILIKETIFFKKQIKILQKNYPKCHLDIKDALKHFDKKKNISLGCNIFKIRVKNSDIPCGKSGDYRSIIFFEEKKDILLPLIVFSKRNKENISIEEI